jgi:hypothetical protein
VLRFLLLAVPLALAALASILFLVDWAGWSPELDRLERYGVARPGGLPQPVEAAALAFEASALVAIFLLVAGRLGRWWLDGLAAGLAAWLFRGPLLVLTVAALSRLPTEPFWQHARVLLLADPTAALAVAALARSLRLPGTSR